MGLRNASRTLLGIAAVAWTAAAPATAAPAEVGQQGQVWNLGTQQSGRTFPTDITVLNRSCKGKHDFEVSLTGGAERFLRITGPTVLRGLRPGQSKQTPALLDLTGLAPGPYEGGRVVITCLDCPPLCRLDHQYIDIQLTVAGAQQAETPPAAAGETDTVAAEREIGDPALVHPGDPEGNCAFLPRVDVDWEGEGDGSEPIVERDGAHVVDLSSGSKLPATLVSTTAQAGGGLSTRARELCIENLGPCEELLAKVRAAEEAYRTAQARADDATEREAHDQAEAASLDEETARDRAYAATLRRQAADWKQLADDARADADLNRARAKRQPDYADSWNREAARDDARARERDANAERLEQEADRIEKRIADKTSRAEARRGRAEAARQEAAAAKQALDLARAEYEACLERQRLECERQKREAALAAARAAAAATTTTSSGSGGGSTTTGGGTSAPPPRPAHPAYESLPVRIAPFCEWIRYNVPYGASVGTVRVVRSSSRDTPSALEVRKMPSGTRSTGQGFEYHCKAESGTAVILFDVVAGDVRRYQLRIGCVPAE